MVEEMSVKKYVRSEEEWIYVLSQNDYFGYGAPDHDSTQQASRELNDCRGPSNFGFWMDNLRNFGTINIFYILGMGHLDNPIEGFFGKHLEREHIVSQRKFFLLIHFIYLINSSRCSS
jgi:hypothetical protein